MTTKLRCNMTIDELLYVKYYDHVRNARVKGLANDLKQDQWIALAMSPCYLCGDRSTVNGVDRMDSTEGYVQGNCASCCKRCNYAKGIMSINDFITMCIEVANRWSQLLPKGPID